MSLLRKLGTLLRVRPDEVEAVLPHDEARAQATLRRRQFMGAAMAIAATPFVPKTWIELPAVNAEWDVDMEEWQRLLAPSIGLMGAYITTMARITRSQNDVGGIALDASLFVP